MKPINHNTQLLYACEGSVHGMICGTKFSVNLNEIYGKKKTVRCKMCGSNNIITPITKYRIRYRLEGMKEKSECKNLAKAIAILAGLGYGKKNVVFAAGQIRDQHPRPVEQWVKDIASNL